jgi:endonuclease/exonuclease/phosphatase family metal-dependent hydrolase
MRAPILVATAIAILALSGGCQTGGLAPDSTVAIGTFNIEWLGDGAEDQKPRTDAECLLIADVIARTNVDVLGVQEIENAAALKRVLRYLDGYDGFVVDAGIKQNVGVIYRTSVDVRIAGSYTPLTVGKPGMRPGLVLQCRKGSFDWTMMVVHLKSTSRFDSTNQLREESRQIRSTQAGILRAWSDSVISAGAEKDVLIVGDFNDFTGRRQQATLTPLLESETMAFLTGSLRSCKNPQWTTIDQVVASTSARERFIKGSEYMEDLSAFLPEEARGSVSDHCPVIVRFRTTAPDND